VSDGQFAQTALRALLNLLLKITDRNIKEAKS